MDAKSKYLDLKQRWIDAPEGTREQIGEELDKFLASLSDAEKEQIIAATEEDFAAMHQEISRINETLNVRDKLAPILPAISVSYIAKTYFRKTPQWFYARMNGRAVNGKPARFTPDELCLLNTALQDLSKRIGSIRL
jgi:hypothetical protein